MPLDLLPTLPALPTGRINVPRAEIMLQPDGPSSFSAPDPLYDMIAGQRFFAELRPEHLRLLRSLAMEVQYEPDEWIFRAGDPANRLFIILKGYVSVEVESESGGMMPVRTLGPGDDLGWAWLFPPYFMHFSARATGPVRAIFFYGTRLREACEEDHELGYRLMKHVAEELVQNLKASEKSVSVDYGPEGGAVGNES